MMKDDEWTPIIAEDGAEVAPGLWYEIFDYSERDYGNDWGWKLYLDGKVVDSSGGGLYSTVRRAGDAAREAKLKYQGKDKMDK